RLGINQPTVTQQEHRAVGNIYDLNHRRDAEVKAAGWLARLDNEEPLTPKEHSELCIWLNSSTEHRDALKALARFSGQANILTELSIPLEPRQGGIGNFIAAGFSWAGFRGVTTAVVFCCLGVVLGFSQWGGDEFGISSPMVSGNGVYQTRVGEQNAIRLADGSVIELNTDSHIQVDYSAQNRAVKLLRGEAHFSVSKDKSRPFEVSAGQGMVRAVGTAFAVRFDRQALEITVTEGEVALAELPIVASSTSLAEDQSLNAELGDATNKTLGNPVAAALVEGQSAVFKPHSPTPVPEGILSLDKDDLQKQMAWRSGMLLFTGEPLSEVIDEINRYTALAIEIADPDIGDIRIGGQFNISDIDVILNVLDAKFNVGVIYIDENNIQLAAKQNNN
ncbi:MAG: FecR domain-containing protein, partial [Porticoccaceae bacterium]|nr:FecR domain-containing protein [Porticoccaceae bacterium]